MNPIMDWSAYSEAGMGDAYADIPKAGGDLAKAVAVCINSHQCESQGPGVMCPSFRVTGDSNLSTGGRVRLLKSVLNEELALDDPALAESMALCVGCKGCKRECENSVDMALIKTEYLAQRIATERPGWRTRLFAFLPQMLDRYPRLAVLIAARNRSPFLAKIVEHLFGITADRQLPQPVGAPIIGKNRPREGKGEGEVVLFVDSFSRHFGRENVLAALEMFEAANYQVHLLPKKHDEPPLCCGRSRIAHGMVEEAKKDAMRVVAELLPYVERNVPVIGLEPACLLAIRDDYRSLGLGGAAEKIASRALLFEEFVAKEMTAGRMRLQFSDYPEDAPELLVHGHCHQKAVGAMKSMRRVLKMLPGLRFEIIDSSCCGMAGGFGLEVEHAEISRRMAQVSLVPALLAKPGATVVANGFSCREQIRAETGRRSKHLAVLIRDAVEFKGKN